MVEIGCFVVTGDGRHRVAIVSTSVPFIGFDVLVVGEWVEACPSDADGCVPSSEDIDLSGLVSPPSDNLDSFPVIFDVQGRFKVVSV